MLAREFVLQCSSSEKKKLLKENKLLIYFLGPITIGRKMGQYWVTPKTKVNNFDGNKKGDPKP